FARSVTSIIQTSKDSCGVSSGRFLTTPRSKDGARNSSRKISRIVIRQPPCPWSQPDPVARRPAEDSPRFAIEPWKLNTCSEYESPVGDASSRSFGAENPGRIERSRPQLSPPAAERRWRLQGPLWRE